MDKDIHQVMMAMPFEWRYRWCANKVCGCMGGVNCSGNLRSHGFDKADWQQWVDKHPPPAFVEEKIFTLSEDKR